MDSIFYGHDDQLIIFYHFFLWTNFCNIILSSKQYSNIKNTSQTCAPKDYNSIKKNDGKQVTFFFFAKILVNIFFLDKNLDKFSY